LIFLFIFGTGFSQEARAKSINAERLAARQQGARALRADN
jgi:hypothetical protein